MGRGFNSKQNRNHERAKAAGRSTRGSSHTACLQTRGKKYKKGEIMFNDEFNVKTVVYEGVAYRFEYKIVDGMIKLEGGVVDYKRLQSTTPTDLTGIQAAAIKDRELALKIVKYAFNISN